MLLFPGISPKVIVRLLFPFVFSIIAITAVVIAYMQFSDDIYSQIALLEQERIKRTAESIIAVFLNSDVSCEIFNTRQSSEFVYTELKPELLGSFNLTEFSIVSPINDTAPDGYPFEEISLAESSVRNGTPAIQYLGTGKENGLLLFYPVTDSNSNTSIARMVFSNIQGNNIQTSKYSILFVSASALILLIIPGLLIKLAGLRRQIEKNGFYQSETLGNTDSSTEITDVNICPSSLLDGFEFPALFRLDNSGRILFMNKSAERLVDLNRKDMKGMIFNELPCFATEDQGLIEYPETVEPSKFTISIFDSSGTSRKSAFRIENLSNTGFAVSVIKFGTKDAGSYKDVESEIDLKHDSAASGKLSENSIQRIRAIIKTARERFQTDPAFDDCLKGISDVLSGNDKNSEMDNQDQSETIEIYSELDAISAALNDVLPERASIELDVPGFLPQVECSRVDFTQIVKNMVFYSLESRSGSVRIKLGARDVPSPVSDSVFSAFCDRTVSKSVSVFFTDGTRMPVVLKEALLDPETDLSGIQRDYGLHVSSVAEVLSRLDCHPVFTESSTGTTLNILFQTSEEYLFDSPYPEISKRTDPCSMNLAICDASRAVRESVSYSLAMYGMNVITSSDLEEMKKMIVESETDYLLLDNSAVEDSLDETISDLVNMFPNTIIILTTSSMINIDSLPELPGSKIRILRKPYSIDELLNIVEMSLSSGEVQNNESKGTWSNE